MCHLLRLTQVINRLLLGQLMDGLRDLELPGAAEEVEGLQGQARLGRRLHARAPNYLVVDSFQEEDLAERLEKAGS